MALLFPSPGFRRPRERVSGMLFDFGVDDLSLMTPTGQTITIDRNSDRTVFDSLGRVATVIRDQPQWSMSLNSEEGVWEPGLAIGKLRTNLVLQSENFGTTWTANNSPTRTAKAWQCGDLDLDLLGDASGATQANYTQNITFTGNTKKGIGVFVKRGTEAPAGGTRIKLRDTTSGNDRLSVLVTWSGTSLVPTVTPTTGTVLQTIALADGVYYLRLQSTSVVAAQTNQLQVFIADVTAQQGDIFIGGVLATDKVYPEGYRRSVASAAQTEADGVTSTVDFPPQDLTIYFRHSKPEWAYDLASSPDSGIFLIGNATVRGIDAYYPATASTIVATLRDAAGTVAQQVIAIPSGSQWDGVIQLRNLSFQPAVRMDVGAGFPAWSTTVLKGFTSWFNNLLELGNANAAGAGFLDANLRRFRILPGHITLAEARGIPA